MEVSASSSIKKSSKLHLKKLDNVRGFAALYVILYHLASQLNWLPDIIKKGLFSYGQEAVMLFFLLSGFVIYLSVHNQPNLNFRDYFIKRFRRIYFPFFLAIALSIIIAFIDEKLEKLFDLRELWGNILMLQDLYHVKPGTWFSTFLGNHPLWSLSYEWWFYMMFFPLYKTIFKFSQRIYLICGVSFFAYIVYIFVPNQACLFLAYFIIWWCGVEAANVYIRTGRFTFRSIKPIVICLLLMSALTAIPLFFTDDLSFGEYPFLMFRHFFIVLTVVLIACYWYQHQLKYFDQIFGWFYSIAPISYGLYIFHYPILLRWDLNELFNNQWLTYGIKLCLLFVLSYVVEIILQPKVNKLLR